MTFTRPTMHNLIFSGLIIFLGLALLAPRGSAQAQEKMSFSTPEEAATTLLQALKTDDTGRLLAIFGPDAQKGLSSGDLVADRHDREAVALAMQQSWKAVSLGPNKKELVIGEEAWPLPIPLVKKGTGWQFDTDAGKKEVLARRVGRNELAMIEICRTYVRVQKEYASQAHDDKPAGLYAPKIRSTPGRQDGLYWSVKPGEPPSPLGDLAAKAASEGYQRENDSTSPLWGYHFRILTAQGSSAPGGAKNYIAGGNMSGGFALVAYPAKYGYSGVMTFIVSQSGAVYQKNLGPETIKIASALNKYNPDKSWTKVRTP